MRLKFCKKNIVTFGELFLKPSDTIRRSDQRVLGSLTSKYCRQLLTMSDIVNNCRQLNVHVSSVKYFHKKTNKGNEVHRWEIRF